MKNRLILIVLSTFLSLNSATAQRNRTEPCGTVARDQYLRNNFPDYEFNRELEKSKIAKWQPGQKSATVITIPVVVHIIYRLETQNISDEQVYSQIDVMNKDFNKLNWDTMKVPAFWKNIVANCEIRFVLANRDPNGQMTSGITRTKTTIKDIASSTGDLYYKTSKGGKDIWNRNNYLNIWVCEISGNLYGFSSYPGSPAAFDGMVIAFESFGTMGTATDPTNKGRTVTHELGHWLDLTHIWGDALCGDDFISDTPTQEKANYDCQIYPKVSCSNGPSGDMFMNYMDYSDDACMYMFTEGQKNHMHATLNNSRSTLFNSPGYNGIDNDNIALINPQIFPNPAQNTLHIKNLENPKFEALKIYDAAGKFMLSKEISREQDSMEIDIRQLSPGLYVLNLIGHDYHSSLKFLVERP